MKAFLTIMSMLLVQTAALANNRICGVLVDDSDSSPLVGVTVVLTDGSDRQVIGTTTDTEGRFELKGVQEGDYLLQCMYVGYDKFSLSLKQVVKDVDLGEIRMKQVAEALEEAAVIGDAVVQKIDRQLVMPTMQQKKAATNGVSLLQYLQIPDISVNAIEKNITNSYGESVQLRINGVETTQAEVMAIRPEDVIRVEYHQRPGLRYGNAAAVLDYIVRKRESGGNLSADLTNSFYPSLGFGNYHISGKYHHRKSSFSALVQWSRRDLEWNRENEETFNFPDRTIVNLETVAAPNRVKYDYITTSLNYNWTNGEKSILNIALNNNTKDIPNSFTDRNSILHQGDMVYEVKDREKSVTHIPSLDIYYQLNFKDDQHLYFDVVGTYIGSRSEREYVMSQIAGQAGNDGVAGNNGVISSEVETSQRVMSQSVGKKYSIISEAIYERPLWKGEITTGIKHNQASMNNVYQNDISSKVSMNTAESSLFAEYRSKIGKLNYTLGVGAIRTYYKQGDHTQKKYFFRPALNLSYELNKFYFRYSASMSGYAPSLSQLSDVEQPMDAWQVRRGNPNLKSTAYFTNRLSGSYRAKWINIDLSARYSYDDKPIMEETIYENGRFVRTFDNQKGFHRLNAQANIQIKPYKQYISISLTPFFNHYVSLGNAYTHTHNNFGFRGSIVGMYRNWIFMAEMNTSNHELWGETINKGEAIHTIAAGYNREKWALQMMVMNPFSKNYNQGVVNLSELAPSHQIAFSRDLCPMFMVNVSFNILSGKQKQTKSLRIENSDTDSGILSGTK